MNKIISIIVLVVSIIISAMHSAEASEDNTDAGQPQQVVSSQETTTSLEDPETPKITVRQAAWFIMIRAAVFFTVCIVTFITMHYVKQFMPFYVTFEILTDIFLIGYIIATAVFFCSSFDAPTDSVYYLVYSMLGAAVLARVLHVTVVSPLLP